MASSRSARVFLQRIGFSDYMPTPSPRLDTASFLVTQQAIKPGETGLLGLPLDRPFPTHTYLLQAEGAPDPDRGKSVPWPAETPPGE